MKDVSPNLFILLTYFALQILQRKKRRNVGASVCAKHQQFSILFSFHVNYLNFIHHREMIRSKEKKKEHCMWFSVNTTLSSNNVDIGDKRQLIVTNCVHGTQGFSLFCQHFVCLHYCVMTQRYCTNHTYKQT